MPSGYHLTDEDVSNFVGFRLPSNKADLLYEHMRECTECDSRLSILVRPSGTR